MSDHGYAPARQRYYALSDPKPEGWTDTRIEREITKCVARLFGTGKWPALPVNTAAQIHRREAEWTRLSKLKGERERRAADAALAGKEQK